MRSAIADDFLCDDDTAPLRDSLAHVGMNVFARFAASDRGPLRDAPGDHQFNVAEQAHALGIARWLYRMRASRSVRLGVAAFAEPGWDLLLDLYISRAADRRLSVTAACIGSRASTATAIRYLAMLCEAGLLERRPDEHDNRRSFVRLSDRGWHCMTALLIDP